MSVFINNVVIRTKKLTKQAILKSIDQISTDMQHSTDEEVNMKRAETIKRLCEAYRIL